MFKPRLKQQEVLNYTGGKMGVSAVPGSGKTQTLSYLAAKLIKEKINDDEEVLVVTLVNSAVDNFSSRVSTFIQDYGLLPNLSYRVRTLHGLAHDIVRERPALVGLSDDFQILDEREGEEIIKDASLAWVKTSNLAPSYLASDMAASKWEWAKKELWPEQVIYIASNFIKKAKDMQLTASDIRDRLYSSQEKFPLVEMGLAIYEDYNRALSYRGAVDFDDLIRLALQAIKSDRDYLMRLRKKWTFILEDEAQDSSFLQEEILKTLTGPGGNWVRVGDPNQAIYETFTTANPKYLRNFLKEKDVISCELPNSGRSAKSIINLANHLIKWTMEKHPVTEIREALNIPFIEPSPPGDPQPNPDDSSCEIRIISPPLTPSEEILFVADSIEEWLLNNKNKTVAVLVPRNDKGTKITEELKKRNIEYIELLKSTRSTRETAGALTYILRYLSDPASNIYFPTIYKVWKRKERDTEEGNNHIQQVVKLLKKCKYTEDFLWPALNKDWLEETGIREEDSYIYEELLKFRSFVRRWQESVILPIDQLLLTIAQDLFQEPSELAIAHKLAVILGNTKSLHPDWHLPEFVREVETIAKNERKFIGFGDEDRGFEPENYKGKVVITTMHRAKGLEWDRVYLMSVNNYDFPSSLPHDRFIAEKWFIRDSLNLQAEALGQLEALVYKKPYEEGRETIKGRIDYSAERLRLLYVGITRAKKDLFLTWNTGFKGELQPSVAFSAIERYMEEQNGR